jgi:hypothetical protein
MTANYPQRDFRNYQKENIERRIQEIEQSIKLNEFMLTDIFINAKPDFKKRLERENEDMRKTIESNKAIIEAMN